MGKDNIEKIINQIINEYLTTHSDLRHLFSEESESKEIFCFFTNNFYDIYSTMGRLFHENHATQSQIENLYSDYLDKIENDYADSIKKQQLKAYQKRMIVATMIYKLISEDLTIDDLPIDYTDFENNDGRHWYRGQANYKWHLTPSMFRNLDNVFSKETLINKKVIEQIYDDNGMLKKWMQVFKSRNVDYTFLSYMQHSIAYSPLLDFTSDFPSALSFSLYNRSSINDFAYTDSAVFQIEVKESRFLNTKDGNLPSDFSITFLPNKYVIGMSILGKPMRTYNDIIKELTPDFVMIDAVNNDRMRYQNGKFVFFYNYLSIQGTVCTWLNRDLNVTKYRIKKDEKSKWCDKLKKDYPYLLVDKMMNPYSYFSDQ